MKSSIYWQAIKSQDHNSNNQLEELHSCLLIPFKERDWKALTEMFDKQDVDQIETDINTILGLIVPEPSWEEDPFDFLQEYL
ncbi:MAG: hypothetical protein IGS49_10050 [Chlorogloeopsis fritschii C42_A2020_084]|uniref:hypothetical protein n=1 Tax=Chlorogloeopsis fritschii TaxID=1124 RepID=UPI001A001AC4|nr:hypothetical protein [Chlorogloeopsis fritschii]MBF2005784.1 hypothetical protein [Chlorogloeopsis fritschii C42_A2020_084]